jgi:hypothetical protein
MFQFTAANGGLILLGAAAAVAGIVALRRYLTRSTPISPVHAGKKDTCKHKFDPEVVRLRARRLQGPPRIDTSNLPAPLPHVVTALQNVTVAGVTQEMNEMTGEVDTTVGGKTVRIESRNSWHALIEIAMQKLEEEYKKLGIPTKRIEYTRRGRKMYNLEATIVGATRPDKIFVYSSHLDCTAGNTQRAENKAPGADDDASGTVGVLNVARAIVAMQKAGHKVHTTARFLHFTGEEQGLWGSYVYSDICANAKEDIEDVYQMDMIAYARKGSKRVDIHDDANRNGSHSIVVKLVRNVVRYGLDLDPVDPHDHAVRDRSDQAGFLDHGYKAVLISEEFSDVGFNPNYHSLNDRVRNCNIPFMVENIKMVIATAADNAGM